jgi:hypothetical protein
MPLTQPIRARMERAFDCDFGAIRVYVSPLPEFLGVRAFACGTDLYFAPGAYRPADRAGQRLLGHELAHVVQQRQGRVVNPFGAGVALVDDPLLEDEACHWGNLAAQGERVAVDGDPSLTLRAPRAQSRVRSSLLLVRKWQGPPLVLQCDGGDGGDEPRQVEASWVNVVSKHPKKVVRGTLTAAGLGITAAQFGTGTGYVALATGAAAATSATGIGLVVAGGAITLGMMAAGAVSAYKTSQHLKLLEKIYEKRNTCLCEKVDYEPRIDDHKYIADKILPWIISQKKHKRRKKIGSALGGGLGVSAWSAIRWLHKKRLGTLGQRRSFYANVLAVHLLTFQCSLTLQIVAALVGTQKLLEMMYSDSNTITPEIAEKMKSV